MKQEVIEKLDGYDEIIESIEYARKDGSDFSTEKEKVAAYIEILHPGRLNLHVKKIVPETHTTKTLRLAAQGRDLPPFQAGQYITLYFDINKIKTSRPYSISSSPNQTEYYDITVRRVENGLVSNFLLDDIKEGDVIESSGPFGTFHYNPIIHDKTMVCLAGGSGITPFMSMIHDIVERDLDRNLYLFYGNKTLDDVIMHDQLTRISNQHNRINYIPVIENPADSYTGKTGFITSKLIKDELVDINKKSFFICGPQAMYNFCLPELHKLGVSEKKIRKEMYGAPLNIWEYPGWPPQITKDDVFTVKINGGIDIELPACRPLLETLEQNRITIHALCRSGECSMCRVKVLSGKVFQPADVPVRASDRQFGYVHSCMSYPIENLEIML
ncbi:MAG: 2Fe-2S iron-sulfur cluster binding domain-containing protein [Deltaproteobacteria bacterium]|nr:2Fe-2S iron-sulfur cluster binding domain-containing protein [Deltaproteobacteria bacterium]MBW2217887.1 2Fe-2S iron-sulfur cluster binding domain-containing protein [Deltaproteobacteria bacterium]